MADGPWVDIVMKQIREALVNIVVEDSAKIKKHDWNQQH